MPTLNINGQRVKVDDSFLRLSPEQQNATVDEIAVSLGTKPSSVGLGDDAMRQAMGEMSDMTRTLGDAAPAAANGPSYGGAATTWLEHAIGDIPIAGPALQTASDYLGTEVYGRLSGQDPSQMREDIWKRREGRTEQYPASAVSGALAGNLAAFGGVGATKTGAQALGIAGKNLAQRAMNSGVTSGSLAAGDTIVRGGSAADIINSGAIGTGIGAAIPVIGQGIRAGLGAVGDRVYPTYNAMRNPSGEAGRRLGLAVTRDRVANPQGLVNANDERVAAEAGVPLLNVDRGGETTRALARSVANQSPEARAVIEKTASDRFAGQGDRAVQFVRRLTGGAVDDLGYQQAIRDTARYVNKPAYQRAYNARRAHNMWHEGFEQLMQAPAMQAAARQATSRGANRAAVEGFTPVRNPFRFGQDGRMTLATDAAGRTASPNLAFWDQVKRNLDSMVGKAQRAGDNTLSADLSSLRGHLVKMMDSTVPEYKIARQGAASYFGADDAIEAGKAFVNNRKAIPEARAAFAKFSAAEKDAFRTGFASELIDKIKSVRDRSNVIDQIFKSQASREQIELVFGPAKARQVEAYVRVEDLADRLRGAMGNSTTARQLVEMGIGAGGGFAVTGDWYGAGAGALAARGGRYLGQRIDDRVMQQIAKLLTSNDPAAMQRAVTNASMSPKYMAHIEAMGRLLASPSRAVAAGGVQ